VAASPPVVTIALEPAPAEPVRSVVLNGLRAFNRQHAPAPGFEPLVLGARANDRVVGGLVGETGWQWLYVDLLWVDETYRRKRIGRRLLEAGEAEARRRGCQHVYLDTFDFQARAFYERLGYVVFGVLDDYPPGHQRFFLRRDFS
jgi:GNAT superfamily N-acetyltransferase